jgi:acyl-coenzyme A synthetase/AMP-(fatty) acid ligase
LEIVDALPVNVSGKVMKYQLREQFKDRAAILRT